MLEIAGFDFRAAFSVTLPDSAVFGRFGPEMGPAIPIKGSVDEDVDRASVFPETGRIPPETLPETTKQSRKKTAGKSQ